MPRSLNSAKSDPPPCSTYGVGERPISPACESSLPYRIVQSQAGVGQRRRIDGNSRLIADDHGVGLLVAVGWDFLARYVGERDHRFPARGREIGTLGPFVIALKATVVNVEEKARHPRLHRRSAPYGANPTCPERFTTVVERWPSLQQLLNG